MDTGVQLGRRFRALKLWMVLRHFGAAGIRAALTEHMRLAALFASWVDDDPGFERVAPVPFSVVCFRARPSRLDGAALDAAALDAAPLDAAALDAAAIEAAAIDAFNEQLLERVNASGEVFLSHTRVGDQLVLRLAVGHLRTTETHVAQAWALLRNAKKQLENERRP